MPLNVSKCISLAFTVRAYIYTTALGNVSGKRKKKFSGQKKRSYPLELWRIGYD